MSAVDLGAVDLEALGLHMFTRQAATWDLPAAAAAHEYERDAELRAFWAAEARHVLDHLGRAHL